MYWVVCRHNQELEQDALATEQEKAKLQQEADSLAEQLEAVLHDKFATTGTSFDADTPIDKTRKFLQSIIMVCPSLDTISKPIAILQHAQPNTAMTKLCSSARHSVAQYSSILTVTL